jgi:hypothetical protein
MKRMMASVAIAAMFLGSGVTLAAAAENAETTVQVQPNSKFAKIALDMGYKQVTDLIGQPNDMSVRRTGKAWIPFYHGTDAARNIAYYKNEGRLEFNMKNRLVAIVPDPSEDGYQ